jgi:hypothetical protein
MNPLETINYHLLSSIQINDSKVKTFRNPLYFDANTPPQYHKQFDKKIKVNEWNELAINNL